MTEYMCVYIKTIHVYIKEYMPSDPDGTYTATRYSKDLCICRLTYAGVRPPPILKMARQMHIVLMAVDMDFHYV